MVSMMIVNTGPFSQYHWWDPIKQFFTVSADGGDGDDGGEHKSLPVRPDRPCHRESCTAGEKKLQIYNLTKICKTRKYLAKNYATGKQFCLVHYIKYTTLQKKMHQKDCFIFP